MHLQPVFAAYFPPRIEEVKIYFLQKGVPEKEAEQFFLFYEKKGWISKKGNFLKNWKSTAYKWVASVLQKEPHLFNRQIH
jgi:hypothetical protein